MENAEIPCRKCGTITRVHAYGKGKQVIRYACWNKKCSLYGVEQTMTNCHREINSKIGDMSCGGINECDRAKWLDNRSYLSNKCNKCAMAMALWWGMAEKLLLVLRIIFMFLIRLDVSLEIVFQGLLFGFWLTVIETNHGTDSRSSS